MPVLCVHFDKYYSSQSQNTPACSDSNATCVGGIYSSSSRTHHNTKVFCKSRCPESRYSFSCPVVTCSPPNTFDVEFSTEKDDLPPFSISIPAPDRIFHVIFLDTFLSLHRPHRPAATRKKRKLLESIEDGSC